MVKFAWSGPGDTRSWGQVLDDLQAAGAVLADWKFFSWVHGHDTYSVVGWVETGEWPADFDEWTASEQFFKDIFKTFRVGV